MSNLEYIVDTNSQDRIESNGIPESDPTLPYYANRQPERFQG